MKSALRLSLGLLLIVNIIGCHTCGHRSCLQRAFCPDCGQGCGCHDGGDACGCDGGAGCECASHKAHGKRSRAKYELPGEAAMYGYDKSVVYTGDDWQGIPQPAMDGVMYGAPSAGCAGCAAPVGTPSTGCAGCAGGAMTPTPASGGCAGCAGGNVTPSPAPGGCAGCAGGGNIVPTPAPSNGGGCASCGQPGQPEAFYSPMGPHHLSPAPAPPAETVPGTGTSGSGDKAAESGTIQKIHWVPRQL